MRIIAVALAIFALCATLVGAQTSETEMMLLAASSAIGAYTTWRAERISTFLKIFIGLFSVETVIFGLATLVDAEGFWPSSHEDTAPPATMAITFAVFSMLTFGAFRVPVVRQIMRITDLYFDSDARDEYRLWPFPAFRVRESLMAATMIVLLVVFSQITVGISLRLSYIRRDYYSALQDLNASVFWAKLLWGFVPWAFTYVFFAVLDYVVQSYLIIRWRRWLTQHYMDRWLGNHRHYAIALEGGEADNPDQRISEDVNYFIDGGNQGFGVYSFSTRLISSLSSLVSYSIVLWQISAQLAFFDGKLAIPGLLFWIALVYQITGTLITHLIGRPLAGLNFERQRREADFRFALARLREYSEQIALLSGEGAERVSLRARFRAIYENFLGIVDRRKKLAWFTGLYGQISPLFPFVLTAPFVLSGKIKIGVIRQVADAFGAVDEALGFFITYYVYLADFRAVLDRLETFDAATGRAEIAMRDAAALHRKADRLSLDARLLLPNGEPLVDAKGVEFAPGQSVLLTGPSGSGKSTLFRAIAGIWPHCEGHIEEPEGAKLMLLPQRPYIPLGSLRAALNYPRAAGEYSTADIEAALVDARLAPFKRRLEEETNWGQRLSGGEQQRIAIARALLAKPDWLFLDEATSALDEKLEAEIYATLHVRLPETTIVSIGHRATLRAFHTRHLTMTPVADGVYAPREEVTA